MYESKYSKVSNVVESQIPVFIRDRKPLYIALLEAYYEYLEQNEATLQLGKTIQRAKNLRNYMDPDTTLDDFLEIFYKQFLTLIPRDINADKRLLLKNIQDFYRARGTEKSFKFLIRLLSTGNNEAEFYYPKNDILRASTSTWYIQKTLRLIDMTYDGVIIDESQLPRFYYFEGRQVTGSTSGATAIVDRADHFYDNGYLIDELTISSINGTFEPGELVTATYIDGDSISHQLEGTINPGVVSAVTIQNAGYGYSLGYQIPVEPTGNSSGSGAVIKVSEISSGSVNAISVVYGGSGYRINDQLLFSSSSGSGANAFVAAVNDSGTLHPNSYIIDVSTISLEANTQLGNAVYSNINSSNANVAVGNAVSTFLYANTGPATFVTVLLNGTGYTSLPSISIIANTRIQALGILGRMNVVNSGSNYNVGDVLTFTNVLGGLGIGAKANVIQTDANGSILNVAYTSVTGFPKGGWGYDQSYLPQITITSSLGTGANVVVSEVLGFGGNVRPSLTDIGGILAVDIISGGSGYNVAPILNLTQSGSGTAEAYANVSLGMFSYPGRYLDDTGHLSSFNFLEDRDYYQNFSYVIRVDESLNRYKKAIESLVHPTGTKLFAEYIATLSTIDMETTTANATVTQSEYYLPSSLFYDGNTYFKTSNVSVSSGISEGVISMWIKPDRVPELNVRHRIISFSANNKGWVSLLNAATSNSTATGICIDVVMYNPANNDIAVNFRSNAIMKPISTEEYTHILISYSGQSVNKCNIFVDDVPCRVGGGFFNVTNTQLVYSNVSLGGGDFSLTSNFRGSMCEVLMSNTWLDITQASVRISFSNNHLPVNLSSTILSNSSFIPIMLFRSNTTFANLNSGQGNSFPIIVGSIAASNVNPQL